MKTLYLYIIGITLLLAALVTGGCTQNGGNISPWFGQWRVETIEIDGVPDITYEGNAFFSFQTSIFRATISYPEENRATSSIGVWEERDGWLNVHFDVGNSGIPQGIHLAEYNCFRIVENDGRHKVLSLTGDDGHVYTFRLKSW